jgi:hypothetical protein
MWSQRESELRMTLDQERQSMKVMVNPVAV